MEPFAVVGTKEAGAKANGLAASIEVLAAAGRHAPWIGAFDIQVPPLAVVATGVFERFLEDNDLWGLVHAAPPDDQLALAFLAAALPADAERVLDAWLETHDGPLAVRSSSVMEDSADQPFAGVYSTLMIAGAGHDRRHRLQEVSEAISYVYASAFSSRARRHRKAAGHSDDDERMAVIVQQVAGRARNGRFYPHVSGVARSYNFYPTGLARPEDGVIELALGLGRSIVEDGAGWRCSPAQPHANPPYAGPADLLEQTQKTFWAIDLDKRRIETAARAAGAGREAGAMRRYTLADAEADGALSYIASTYSADDDRIVAGIGAPGARVVDFAPILKARRIPLVDMVVDLLKRFRDGFGRPVEMEFALTFSEPGPLPAGFDFLQVRPMAAAYPEVDVPIEDLPRRLVLAASDRVVGNGSVDDIRDIVYVKPSAFEPGHGRAIAADLEATNLALTSAGRPYLLIGIGRWGTSDASAGIPADFAQIAGARVIVEATLPDFDIMPSHGSHFFHNIASRRVIYFSVGHGEPYEVDWSWLDAQPAAAESRFVRHVGLEAPLTVRADGRVGRGLVVKPA